MKTIFNATITDMIQIATICLYLRENWFAKLVIIAFRVGKRKPRVYQVDSPKVIEEVSKFLMDSLGKGDLKVRVEAT
jgi:hypothetical protein